MITFNEFQRFHERCNQWITTGQVPKAQHALNALRVDEVPGRALRDLCNLYRRAYLWEKSLVLLRPKVYPRVANSPARASPGEKVEYALALQRVGAHRESVRLLNEPEVQNDPQSLFARACYEIFHWNYELAATLIQEYLNTSTTQPYEASVARVNLLACWATLQDPKFVNEFENLKRDLRSTGHSLLLGNVLEVGAQYLIMSGDLDAGESCLREAEQLLKNEGGLRLMFVDKWRTIAHALKTKSVEPLDRFRSLALSRRHWETLRDLDYFRAMLQPESPWSAWVYFGTPHAGFRRRMERWRSFPDSLTVSRSGDCVQVIDPWFTGDQHGEMSHLLLNLLLRDFYRPMRVGEIFSELFWDNRLEIVSAQDRVHQLIRRLRKWINNNNLAFRVFEIEGSYAVRIAEDTGLVCRKKTLPAQKLPFIFGRFQNIQKKAITARDWAERLNVTPSKARGLLAQARQAGLVDVSGRGMATKYKVVD